MFVEDLPVYCFFPHIKITRKISSHHVWVVMHYTSMIFASQCDGWWSKQIAVLDCDLKESMLSSRPFWAWQSSLVIVSCTQIKKRWIKTDRRHLSVTNRSSFRKFLLKEKYIAESLQIIGMSFKDYFSLRIDNIHSWLMLFNWSIRFLFSLSCWCVN